MDNLIDDPDPATFAERERRRELRVAQTVQPDSDLDTADEWNFDHSADSEQALLPKPVSGQRPGSGDAADDRGPRRRRISWRMLPVAMLALAVAAVAPFAWNYLQSYESTDDAQIDGHIDPISSRVDGTVLRVYPEDDDRVRKGDLLAEIDPRDCEVAVESARANLAQAQAQLESAKADYATALSKVEESNASLIKAARDVPRYQALLAAGAGSRVDYEESFRIAKVDEATVAADRAAANSTQKLIASKQAAVQAAAAALDQAMLNLGYTKLYAPADGIVGKRSVQTGSRIQPAQTLMYVTETNDIWVIGNFKETQLARMRAGQRVTVHVDTFGRDYQGYVRNMPGASGDRFSLLPPENATGNYVKVVQRLPVRIVLLPGQDPEHLLHPGMSVEPSVWLR